RSPARGSATSGIASVVRRSFEELGGRASRTALDVGGSDDVDVVGPSRPAPGGKVIIGPGTAAAVRADIKHQAIRARGRTGQARPRLRVEEPVSFSTIVIDLKE